LVVVVHSHREQVHGDRDPCLRHLSISSRSLTNKTRITIIVNLFTMRVNDHN
ncbi:hypothetical protein CEP51_016917, partial [Fusarium floridanum]